MPLIFSPRVVAPRPGGPTGFDSLAVDAAGTGLRLFAGLFPDLPSQSIVDRLPQPAPTPAMEVVAYRPFAGEVMGQSVPDAAVGQEVEDGVEDVAEVCSAGRAGRHRGRQEALDDVPLFIGQIAGVGRARRGIHGADSGFRGPVPDHS